MNPLYAEAWSDPSLRASRPGRGFYRRMRCERYREPVSGVADFRHSPWLSRHHRFNNAVSA